MNRYIKKSLEPYRADKFNRLYEEWIKSNSIYYMRYFSILALAITSLLIPFDYLLYENPEIYVSMRALLMSLYILLIVIIFKFLKYKTKMIVNVFILIPPLSYNLAYSYFLYKADSNEEYYLILLLATFFVIIISNIFIHKFYREQYALGIISIITLFCISLLKPAISSDIIKLIIFHIVSWGICIYYRHEFMLSIINKYDYLSSLLPNKFAKLMSISDENLDINTLFPTKEYYAVCLCADWRNYQNITNESSRNKVEDMLEKFYTIIYKNLDKLHINGQYYADWTADELFIIFYGKDKQENIIRNEALTFAHLLSTTLYLEINSKIDQNIRYDIGLSSGKGLIGLQGPPNFKKTAITGTVAGNSKRFETEAKKIRKEKNNDTFPTIVMDQDLNNNAINLESFKNNMIQNKVKGSIKDIIDYELYSWSLNKSNK